MTEAKCTKTPWRVEKWSGGDGYRAGFYLARSVCGKTEWLRDRQGRARRFTKEETARAATPKEKA